MVSALEYVAIAACLLLVTKLAHRLHGWSSTPNLNFPIVGKPGQRDYSQDLLEGYRKVLFPIEPYNLLHLRLTHALQYPHSPFIIPVNPPRVIMPMSTYKDAMLAPTTKLSFLTAVYEMFQGKYTHLGTYQEPVVATIKNELTKSISDVLPIIQEESDYIFRREIGTPDDWTPIKVYPTMLRFVSIMSGRIFVGLPLSRDEKWINASITFTRDCMAIAYTSQLIPWSIRPWIAPFLPHVRKAVKDLKFAQSQMEPIVQDALRLHDSEEASLIKPGSRGTFVTWLLNHMPSWQKNAERVGINQMVLSFVSIHSTSTTMTFVLFHLATHPAHIQPLRDELETVLDEERLTKDARGRCLLTKGAFQKLRKLDSFLKESQRCSPMLLVTGARTVLADYTFSDGTRLPKGTQIAWPMWGVYNSTSSEMLDEAYNANTDNPGPGVFDGFRFSRLRDQPGRGHKHQAVLTGEESLNFGHGSQACPGRFFAVYEIKAIMIEILQNYDIRLKDGVVPKTWSNQLLVNPDFSAMIEIKRRTV